MIGRDDVRVGRDLFDLALARVGHAGEEVDQSSCNVLVRGLKVDDHRALFLQMVGDLARVFKALGLDEHDLELRGRVDVHDLVAAVLRLALGAAAVGKGARVAAVSQIGEIIFIFLVLILVGVSPLFQIIQNTHGIKTSSIKSYNCGRRRSPCRRAPSSRLRAPRPRSLRSCPLTVYQVYYHTTWH